MKYSFFKPGIKYGLEEGLLISSFFYFVAYFDPSAYLNGGRECDL